MTKPHNGGMYQRNRVEDPEVTFVRILLLQKGWSSKTLAERCGLKWSTIRHAFSEGFPDQRTRLLCDDAFGEPVLEPLLDWHQRKALGAAIGFDPQLCSKVELQEWATTHSIRFSDHGRILKKAELISKMSRQLLQPGNEPLPLKNPKNQ